MTNIIYKYRVWCSTENKWEYIWLEDTQSAPTSCPTNVAHTIDSNKTTIVSSSNVDPQTDSDNAIMSRQKIAKSGHHYQGMFAELKIGHADIYSKKKDNSTGVGFWTVTRYDSNNAVTSDNSQAVKTVYLFQATHDVSIIGIKMWQSAAPTSDIRFWVEGAPHIPLANGGEVKFIEGGGNFKLMGSGLILDLDGRVPKDVLYDATYYSHRFELTVVHPVSTDHTILTQVEYYKPPGV